MYAKYTGIILKKHPLNEADELLTIYTKTLGKLRTKAIGSRKIQSRLGGNLQTLNEIDFEVAGSRLRPRAETSLPVIISVRARAINTYLRSDLKKFAYALVGAETLYRLTPDRQENSQAYEATVEFLRDLGESTEENITVRAFQLKLLRLNGFRLPVDRCLNCQRDLSKRQSGVHVALGKGGLLCDSCATLGKTDFRLDQPAFRQLAELAQGGVVVNLAPAAERAIEAFLDYVLEREIKSMNFLNSVS